ncbi:MAG: hypothetical protein ABF868_08690 [Sporolactobacillus sp.]
MNTEKSKLRYLSEHGWKPRRYTAMNRSSVVWQLQVSDGFNQLESTLHMLEIERMELRSLAGHCDYVEKRMRRELERMNNWHLPAAE